MSFISFPEELFDDAGTLRLSSRSQEVLDADCLEDFTLDDSARILASLAHSQISTELEGLLHVSKMSADLSCMLLDDSIRTMESSRLDHDDMRVDSIQVQENVVKSSCCNNNNVRSSLRRNGQPPPGVRRIQLNDVKFDPTPCNLQKDQEQLSCDDLDTSAHSTAISNDQQTKSRLQHQFASKSCVDPSTSGLPRSNSIGLHEESSYNEALQKLADSIKRTEQSRRQLMMHRTLIDAPAPQQRRQSQHVVDSTQQQLQQRVAAASVVCTRPPPVESLLELSPNDRSSIMNAFFSGSRGTLTNGLDHSRRQLKMYMDQVGGNQTL